VYRFEKDLTILRKDEIELIDQDFDRGYDIPCRFCGRSSAEHSLFGRINHEGDETELEPEWMERLKGFRVALISCPNYVPKNLKEWDKARKADKN